MPDSVEYNLFTPIDFRIKPKARRVIFLDYALGIPEGNYGRIASKLRKVTCSIGICWLTVGPFIG